MTKELLDALGWNANTPSCSAFVQQREKLLPEFFESIFHGFSTQVNPQQRFRGYRLVACDGSDLSIARNPKDPDTFFVDHREEGFNLLHLNAFYDLCSHIYLDGLVQSRKRVSEYRALWQMIGRSKISENVIVLADRGFESYNVLAHAQEKGWNYLIRVKDRHSKGILSGLPLHEEDILDKEFGVVLGRSQRKAIRGRFPIYKCIQTNMTFDYLDTLETFYPLFLCDLPEILSKHASPPTGCGNIDTKIHSPL